MILEVGGVLDRYVPERSLGAMLEQYAVLRGGEREPVRDLYQHYAALGVYMTDEAIRRQCRLESWWVLETEVDQIAGCMVQIGNAFVDAITALASFAQAVALLTADHWRPRSPIGISRGAIRWRTLRGGN